MPWRDHLEFREEGLREFGGGVVRTAEFLKMGRCPWGDAVPGQGLCLGSLFEPCTCSSAALCQLPWLGPRQHPASEQGKKASFLPPGGPPPTSV